MTNLDLMKEAAALAGYNITGSSGADPGNKTRAQRRVNMIKTDIVSRYGGRWDANYKEGWLPIVPLYTTGTADFTQGSNSVTGHGTIWTSSMTNRKIISPDGAHYKIASVESSTVLILTQAYQGPTVTLSTYSIWKDEYRLYPDVLSVGGFVDYELQQIMDESWPRNMKQSYPVPSSPESPTIYTIVGRESLPVNYNTGTVAGTVNNTSLQGSGTAWLANLEPGCQITIGSYTYTVKHISADTSLELYQNIVATIPASSTYSVTIKNAILVRFRKPTTQRVVSYWYWTKDYPFMNDSDEDWIAEQFPRVIINGMAYFDYVDKNDVARATTSHTIYEDSIKNMKVAIDNAYTGVRILGYSIPPEARD